MATKSKSFGGKKATPFRKGGLPSKSKGGAKGK